jgi:23S rRNA pseudouridine2605 synthase
MGSRIRTREVASHERPLQIRLQKILSAAGVASRRTAESLILQGRVSLNGEVVRTLGTRADPAHADIRVDGRRIPAAARPVYLLLNKPTGYVTTRRDPEGRPTVLSLLGRTDVYLYPVGRLDFDSEGVLLLTNDGDLAARLTHPRHGVPRVYEARVRGVPPVEALRTLAAGVPLDGKRTAPARVRLLGRRDRKTATDSVIELEIHEGRNRQVRRMCQAVGHPVIALRRTRFGPLGASGLKPGQWRELSPHEVQRLREAVELSE